MQTNTVVDTDAGSIPVLVDGDAGCDTSVVLAHGAGSGMDSDFMAFMAERLAASGSLVYRFDFPYMAAGRKAPDRQPVLEQTFRAVAEAARRDVPLFLGGKSMGGRIASHVVASGTAAAGLIFFGYPLHPPGRPDRLRDAHLYGIDVPMLFVEGTRDPFCPLDTLDEVRGRIPGPTEVVAIEDGDHSLKVRRSSGRTTAEAWSAAADAAAAWVAAMR